MEILTRQIAACMNDAGELAGFEARREAVYPDGSRRVLEAEAVTAADFAAVLAGEDGDTAANLARTLAQLAAAAAINTRLDAEIVGARRDLEAAQATIAAQAEQIATLSQQLAEAEKRAVQAERAERNASRQPDGGQQ